MLKPTEINIWKRFWKLTVLSEWKRVWKWKVRTMICKCDCWNIKQYRLWHLMCWDTMSCGNHRNEYKNRTTHWMTDTDFFKKYWRLKYRCDRINCPKRKYYWWRLIKCEWNNFEEFYKDMSWTYKDTLTIDRIDNNWNYCKENCRWTTMKEQAKNKRISYNISKDIEYKWETKKLTDWARELWVPAPRLYWRIVVGKRWIDKAFNTQPRII